MEVVEGVAVGVWYTRDKMTEDEIVDAVRIFDEIAEPSASDIYDLTDAAEAYGSLCAIGRRCVDVLLSHYVSDITVDTFRDLWGKTDY